MSERRGARRARTMRVPRKSSPSKILLPGTLRTQSGEGAKQESTVNIVKGRLAALLQDFRTNEGRVTRLEP